MPPLVFSQVKLKVITANLLCGLSFSTACYNAFTALMHGGENLKHLIKKDFCSYLTIASISAWKLVALVYDSDLAVATSKADRTRAGVIFASVEACGPVMTWAIVGTEI